MAEKKKDYSVKNKFEFALNINGFPVCTRFFSADEYNPKTRNSVDIRNQIDDIVAMLQETLKKRDVDYEWEKYDLRQNAFMNKWSDEIKSAKKYVENNKKTY